MRGLFSANRLRVLMDRFCVHYTVNQSTIAFGAVEKFTVASLKAKYEKAVPITAVTAYDFPSAKQVDDSGIDIVLVGDSAAMVVHGHSTTLPITLEEMISHAKAVKRGTQRAMIVGDLPFGSYEESDKLAIASAVRYVKEGGVDAVKLEGATEDRLRAIDAIVSAGVPVMGHIGLTPQSVNVLGGFKSQGKTASCALKLVESAVKLEEFGCFAIVVECVPELVAQAITDSVSIPTIGIGAGICTSGQVLVYHDLLGLTQHPHHASVTPKFCKRYAELGEKITSALDAFKFDVEHKHFPSKQFVPYGMSEVEAKRFVEQLAQRGLRC